MYVRTKEGKIFNCYTSESMGKPIYYVKNSLTNGFIDYDDVYKASPNIIDVVQVGDYVNGYFVEEKQNKFLIIDSKDSWCWGEGVMPIEEIKSIVTKEQFENMEYKLGDK